jgi:nucleoside-diphosphate-sugar epimerase
MALEANASRGMRTLVVSPGVILSSDAATPLGGLVRLFLQGELPYRILESVWLAISDADDVGRCLAAAIERGHGGRRYFATGACLPLGDLYSRLAQASGIPAPRRRLPDLLVEELGLLTPVLPPRSFLRRLVLPRELVAHLRRLAPLQNERTRSELEFEPAPLSRTLEAMIESGAGSAQPRGRVRG